ncbi:O-Antigen ligase [Roseimaritima multifibrata]|uniref:O-Antigen ligase n=1 Tax=Roseimaritima multifibrata TaxID=1930274 RepID=A0A517MPH5_9BACT|nr:O-antigen ligase family protein [Roseimaritima multifibrata]QDS96687.1 O-Antigen ligase [Roseimaritima multifibrata]
MELLGILFGLAALVWMIPLLRQASLPMIGFGVLVLGIVFGPSFFAIDSVVQVSLDRVLWGVMVVWFAVVWRQQTESEKKPLTRCDIALFLFMAWLAVCTQNGQAPTGTSPFARWLFYIFLPMGMYWVARSVQLTRRDIDWVLSAFIVLGVYLSLTGICEWRGWHGLVFPKYIVDPTVWEFYGRARGPLLNPAGNGIVIAVGLAAAAVRSLQAERIGRVAYGLLVMVMLAGCYATLTRGVWIGAVLVLGIVTLAYAPRWLRIWGLAATVCLAAAMMLGLKDQLIAIKRDKGLSAEASAKSLELRPLLGIIAYEMFKDAPLTGHGFGTYLTAAKEYDGSRAYDMPIRQARGYVQHNLLLSLLVDTGLIGLSAFMAALLFWTSRAWRLARAPTSDLTTKALGLVMLSTLAMYLFNGMFQDVLVIPMVQMVVFFVAGLTVGTSLQERLPAAGGSPEATKIPVWGALGPSSIA